MRVHSIVLVKTTRVGLKGHGYILLYACVYSGKVTEGRAMGMWVTHHVRSKKIGA